MADIAPAAPGGKSKGAQLGAKHSRTRSGCLCCRLRRKKCDGVRPTCIACERNVLICSWPTSNLSRQDKALRNGAKNIPPANPLDHISSSESLRYSSHDGYDYKVTKTVRNRRPLSSQHDTPTVLLSPVFSSVIGPGRELVYRNYVTRTANTVSTLQDAENPFITILLPLAEFNSLVLDSILALSAAHLWKQPERTVGAEQWMTTHEMLAVRGLKYGLTNIVSKSKGDTSGTSVVMIITTLLLCLVEAMKGESNLNATFHLKGSRMLLYQWISTQESAKETKIRAFVVELYLYLTISIGVPLGVEMEPHQSVAQDTVLLFPYVVDGERCGPLLGCAHELFQMIPQIHTLAHTCSARSEGTATSLEINSTFHWLLGRLFAWKPPEGSEVDFISSAKVYQQALLVFLLTSTEGLICKSINTVDIFDQAFGMAVRELDNIPFNAPISTTLTWPLAVLGASSVVPEHQSVVRNRLTHLSQNLHFAVFDQVLCVLEALWADPLITTGMLQGLLGSYAFLEPAIHAKINALAVAIVYNYLAKPWSIIVG